MTPVDNSQSGQNPNPTSPPTGQQVTQQPQTAQEPQDPSNQQQPIQQPSTAPSLENIKFSGNVSDKKDSNIKFLILPIIAVVILGVLYFTVFHPNSSQIITTTTLSTTTQTTTTVSYMRALDACSTINQSGSYYLSNSIDTNIASGSCINIRASNVNLICNQNIINGSGPYVNQPPYTYGILIQDVNNISVQNCQISEFSFGIFENNTSNVNIKYNNLSNNYISNIRLERSIGGILQNNILAKSVSKSGSISVTNNSTENTFMNNIIQYNPEYGFAIDSINNKFLNNSITNTGESFYCSPLAGLKGNNSGVGNICYNSTNCNFLECSQNNYEYNTAGIRLKNAITGCGTIFKPGIYNVQENIDMNNYILTQFTSSPCITLNANNVTLDCNNYSITNANIGIYVGNHTNDTVRNCNIQNTKYGLILYNASPANLTNITLKHNSAIGLLINSSLGDIINKLDIQYSKYGVYLDNSPSSTINNFKVTNNTYGVYLSNSLDNSFANGFTFNNTMVDIYANSNATIGAVADLMQHSNCGITDAVWAILGGCQQQISVTPPFKYSESLCATIKLSGVYLLNTNIVNVGSNCFNIIRNNTILNCKNHVILGTSNIQHSGIIIDALNNVTITNCTIEGFGSGIYINKNATNININHDTINNTDVALNISNIYAPNVYKNVIGNAHVYGLYLVNATKANITFNEFKYGSSSTAIQLNNSRFNRVNSNYMNGTKIGINLFGNSTNNTVYNNSATTGSFGYVCGVDQSGINSGYKGIDYGLTKSNCPWIAVIGHVGADVPCATTITPNTYSLLSDYVYPFGDICYTIKSNLTTINCNGHTIISTDGGTFLNVINSSSVELSNCILIGFTAPITIKHSSVKIINNTVYLNTSLPVNSRAITINNSSYVNINNNKIIAPYYGIVERNVNSGSIMNNTITAYILSVLLYNVSGEKIAYNQLPYYGIAGMQFVNSTQNIFGDNYIKGLTGISCSGSSAQQNSDTDIGGNSCSSNNKCVWISSSNACAS